MPERWWSASRTRLMWLWSGNVTVSAYLPSTADFVVGATVIERTLVRRFRLVFAGVWRRVDGFGFQDVFGITGHRFLLFDGAVDGAKVGSAALLGNGLGRGAHCDGGGAEPSYGEEPLDELASEAGREVEP